MPRFILGEIIKTDSLDKASMRNRSNPLPFESFSSVQRRKRGRRKKKFDGKTLSHSNKSIKKTEKTNFCAFFFFFIFFDFASPGNNNDNYTPSPVITNFNLTSFAQGNTFSVGVDSKAYRSYIFFYRIKFLSFYSEFILFLPLFEQI